MRQEKPPIQKTVSGWSNTNFSESNIFVVKVPEEIPEIIKKAKSDRKTILARGGGLSYGDQALNNNQIIIDTTKMNLVLDWNSKNGILKAQCGATYDDILQCCLKDNWTLPAIAGTRFVTMGGALANNIHGKNNYSSGNFGKWVKEFKIILTSGESQTCSREENADLFFGAIGGSGLLGIVTEMTLQLIQIPSPFVSVRRSTKPNIDEILNELDTLVKNNNFVIAQVDCFSKGKKIGRGTIHSGNFTPSKTHTKQIESMRKTPKRMFGIFPKNLIVIIGKYILNDYIMRIISSLKYLLDKATSLDKEFKENLYKFTFLLDNLPGWKKVFRNGFFEYQPLIPKEKASDVIKQLITLTHQYKMPAYLSAIKIHRKDEFLLSYSLDGFSFAMDIPRRPKEKEKQDKLFREMNKLVIDAGGIIYLAKDASLTETEFRKMYKVDEFLELKKKYDPEEMFQSDMYRRIFKK